jgi:hypothetical protein
MKQQPDEIVFVVRMWVRGDDRPAEGDWRGSVHDVQSGQRFYVSGTRDIADFIGTRLAERSRANP